MKYVVLGSYSSKNEDLNHYPDTQNLEFYRTKNVDYQNGNIGNNRGILKTSPDPEFFCCAFCKDRLELNEIPLYTLGEYFVDPTDPNKYYCDRDYLQRFAHLCFKCELPITVSEMIVSLDRTYHPACFVCSDCQLPFEKDLCFEYKGYPLCERHWHNKNGTICPICDGIIKNKCVIFDGYKYHDDCFLNQ
ncbi:Paxillin-like protein [Smittium culicis]|uniref:Paxillin-like protein n=1 Tax=Smittium culicis TaxID=133412 RepID=A0A1R1XP68_9FUNG|nr:Paxillin-like protein [Smittium culicis]